MNIKRHYQYTHQQIMTPGVRVKIAYGSGPPLIILTGTRAALDKAESVYSLKPVFTNQSDRH